MSASEAENGINLIQTRIEFLSNKMDHLISIQEKVLSRLDGMSQDIDGIERDVETLKVDKEEIHILTPPSKVQPAMTAVCQEMTSIMSVVNQRSEQQAQKLEGMEKLVLSIQQVISVIGDTVKNSKIMELMFKKPAARKNKVISTPVPKCKESKGKAAAPIKKTEKKTTSTKATKDSQDSRCSWEVSISVSSPKSRLHGPKHLFSSHKSGDTSRDHKSKDGKEKSRLSTKDLKAQKKKKQPPDSHDTISLKKQALLLEEVQKLNRENAERSGILATLDLEAGGHVDEKPQEESLTPAGGVDFILEVPKMAQDTQDRVEEVVGETKDVPQEVTEEEDIEAKKGRLSEASLDEVVEEVVLETCQAEAVCSEAVHEPAKPDVEPCSTPHVEHIDTATAEQQREEELQSEQQLDSSSSSSSSSKRRVTVEDEEQGAEDTKKSRVEEQEQGEKEEAQTEEEGKQKEVADEDMRGVFKADGVEFEVNFNKQKAGASNEEDEDEEQYFIDCTPPPPAPFSHRIVSAKPNQINAFYTINRQEVLGGGRFGQVHKCIENSSGLTLAAKIIKARSAKEKEIVKNEILVMNQLDHANLIQLYAAYESRTDIILVLEYVDGGELFDRVIDENYTLTELDSIMFIRQICEGLRHMHRMYILHLDLKPENILCISRVTNKIKIIDFGLARKYNPREKLKVNFGTPEFLAPEVINYDFVSFNTDMWSLGVIAYMLLSGLSPFLGDDDSETLNNILQCEWNFEEEEFNGISDEAKDFISKLLLINKSWRIGAAEALKHPWLSDAALHHRLHIKKNMCHSRRGSCVPES